MYEIKTPYQVLLESHKELGFKETVKLAKYYISKFITTEAIERWEEALNKYITSYKYL